MIIDINRTGWRAVLLTCVASFVLFANPLCRHTEAAAVTHAATAVTSSTGAVSASPYMPPQEQRRAARRQRILQRRGERVQRVIARCGRGEGRIAKRIREANTTLGVGAGLLIAGGILTLAGLLSLARARNRDDDDPDQLAVGCIDSLVGLLLVVIGPVLMIAGAIVMAIS